MNKLTQKIRHFFRDEEGLTMVEYAVAGGLITVAAAAAFSTLGGDVKTAIGNISKALTGGGSAGGQ